MRYMFLVSVPLEAMSGPPPSMELIQAVEKLAEKTTADGSLIARGGLMPPGMGAVQITLKRGKINVIDGPFAETKEVIGGFSIMEFASHEEALAGAKEMMELHRLYGGDMQATLQMLPFMGHHGDGDSHEFFESKRS